MKARVLIQKEYMTRKIAESCKRLNSMTFVSVNADGSDKPLFLSD